MKTTRFLTTLIMLFWAIVAFAQDTPLEESFTASNGITVSFPAGYTASEQAEGALITVLNEAETNMYLFFSGQVLLGAVGSPLNSYIGLADDQVQAALTTQGGDFGESESIEYSINDMLAIGRTYIESNSSIGIFLLFLLDSGEPMLLLATGTEANFEPDVPLLLAMANAVTVDTIVSRVPRTEGNLVVIDIASGMQLTFELPEGWGLADIERNPARTALVGAFADTSRTNATIVDLSRQTDPVAFFNEQVTELAATAGHTDFSLDTDIVKGVTSGGFPIAYYESAQFVEPATNITPSVWVALVEIEESHYVFVRGQSVTSANLTEWSGQLSDMANTFTLRPAYMPIPENAIKLECATVTYDMISKENPTAVVACPSNCSDASGRVWGTDIYTDDSSVCLAAIHAGVIKSSTGGAFTIEWLLGQESYIGTTANGITTSEYGAWGGSFVVKALGE